MDLQTKVNDHINTVYQVWQSQDLMKHKRLTLKMKRVINEAFLSYTMVEICDAIRNYGKIYNDHRSWFKVRYPLDIFIAEKMDRFLEENKPMETHYNSYLRSGGQVAGGQPPPSQPAISPDSLNNYKEKFKQWKKEKSSKKI